MTGTAEVAVRNGHAPASVPAGALAIEAGQTSWTTMQAAALGQLGIADAPEGDKQVFLHVSQRTGLDPFARQIYMIGRNEKKNVKRGTQWIEEWSTKYTIQTGIEGFRVIRGRAERAEGIRGILSRPVFYNGQGDEFKVWFFKNPPAAVELTYTVRDRNGNQTPYTSILRYDEYVQTKKQTVNGADTWVPVSQWATKPTHMLEKCTEADVYRKAFPQDFSGVDLEDAVPVPDPADAPPAQPQRQRVTAADARARNPQTVTATVVTPDVPPADEQPATPEPAVAPAPPSGEPAGGTATLATTGQVGLIQRQLERLEVSDRTAKLRIVGLIAGRVVESSKELTDDEARKVRDTLEGLADGAALDGLRAELAMADDPRGEVPGGE